MDSLLIQTGSIQSLVSSVYWILDKKDLSMANLPRAVLGGKNLISSVRFSMRDERGKNKIFLLKLS
jgi:hypothetical protein